MIFDAILTAFASITNIIIGGLIRYLGDPVSIPATQLEALAEFRARLYLINSFLPITEMFTILSLLATALTTWALFKLVMWIFDLFRIGKSYQE